MCKALKGKVIVYYNSALITQQMEASARRVVSRVKSNEIK